MRICWIMKRLIDKCKELLKFFVIKIMYHPEGFVHILGKVYLDNPNIIFGKNITLYPNVHIFGPGRVKIEDNVSIGDGTIICSAEDIVIGADSMIAAQCYIVDCNHGMHLGVNMREQPLSIHHTRIGKNVWVGCGCKILAGSNVEDGVVIGAGTVVSGVVHKNNICFMKRDYCNKERK